MRSYGLRISSPEGDVFSGEAVKLTVRGTEGELAVMAGHIPFVTYVKPCDCRIELPDGSEIVGAIPSGVLTVGKEKTVLLCGAFERK